jgi:hypothetical protein
MWLGINGLKYLNVPPIPVWPKQSTNKTIQKIRKTKPNEAIEIKPLKSERYATNSENEAIDVNSIYFNSLRTKNACFSTIMNGAPSSLFPFGGREAHSMGENGGLRIEFRNSKLETRESSMANCKSQLKRQISNFRLQFSTFKFDTCLL